MVLQAVFAKPRRGDMESMVGSRSHPKVWPGLTLACFGEGRDELRTSGIIKGCGCHAVGFGFY